VKPKKGRRFGTGSVAPVFDLGGSSSSSGHQTPDPRIDDLQRELRASQAAQQEADKRHQAELQRLREEQAQSELRLEQRLRAQFFAEIEAAMARRDGRAPPPPPPNADS
jgi:hypothetical protein